MASPPVTDREYAYFQVSGAGQHETITERLGIKPSQAWNSGDAVGQTSRKRSMMMWRIDSGLDDRQPLAAHIEALLLILVPREEQLRQLSPDYDIAIHCVGHYPPAGHGVHLGRETIRCAARLSVAFDFDFYYVDSPE
jgi:hypothetical protein